MYFSPIDMLMETVIEMHKKILFWIRKNKVIFLFVKQAHSWFISDRTSPKQDNQPNISDSDSLNSQGCGWVETSCGPESVLVKTWSENEIHWHKLHETNLFWLRFEWAHEKHKYEQLELYFSMAERDKKFELSRAPNQKRRSVKTIVPKYNDKK